MLNPFLQRTIAVLLVAELLLPAASSAQTSQQIAPASNLAVRVIGTSNTQAVLSFTAPDTNACSITVSENSSLSPLIHDVDPTLFSNANLDTRAEALSHGSARVFVVGKRVVEKGLDGNNYSRALQTNTTHYYRIMCGGLISQGSFTTSNIPFGSTFGEGLKADLNQPLGYIYPTVPADRDTSFIDPQTGVLIKRVTLPNDVSVSPNGVGWSSAGFHELCAPKLSVNGFYHCLIPNDWAPYLYAINPTTAEVRFLGNVYFWGQALGLKEGVTPCYKGGTAAWDSVDPNVMYCSHYTNSGDSVILKLTYTGNDQPMTLTAVAGLPPSIPQTIVNLTPDPNTLSSLLRAYSPNHPLPGCVIGAYMSGTVSLECRIGPQDSYAWIGAYNLGDKTPGKGFVQAFLPMYALPQSRWCSDHSYEYVGDVPVLSFATQFLKGGGPGLGPYEVVLNSDMPAISDMTRVDVTTSWDPNWGAAPSGYASGEPVSPNPDHFLQTAEVGDRFVAAGEYMTIVQKISPTQWVLKRGLGTDQSYYYPRAHSKGDRLVAYCNLSDESTPDNLPYLWWNFVQSPTAAQGSVAAVFGSHPVARGNYRIGEYAFRIGDIANPATWVQPLTGSISPSPTFAGANSLAWGNSFEKHVSMPFFAPPWFFDISPFIGGNTVTSGSDSDTFPLGGNLYLYFYNGLDNYGSYGDGLSRKQLATFAFNGLQNLLDISGPSSLLTGSTSDAYKYCVAYKAGECVQGSQAGSIYFNTPTLPVGSRYCQGNEFYSGSQNICIGDIPLIGFGINQFKVQQDTTGQAIRTLSRVFAYAHYTGTGNVKPLPDGSWLMYDANGPTLSGIFMMKVPPIPEITDGIDRTTFVRAPITLAPPQGLGIVSAKVTFGYAEQGGPSQYFCTSRREGCVVVSANVNDANPFMYDQSDSYPPLPCSVSCAVTLPVLPLHVAYYKVAYLDNTGTLVASDQGVAIEKNTVALGASVNGITGSVATPAYSLRIVPAITRDEYGNYVVQVSFTNVGLMPISNIVTTLAQLNAFPPNALPPIIALLAPGATATTPLIFPPSAGVAGKPAALKVAGSSQQTSFSASMRLLLP